MPIPALRAVRPAVRLSALSTRLRRVLPPPASAAPALALSPSTLARRTHSEAAMGDNFEEAKCPFVRRFAPVAGGGTRNEDWWPNQLRLDVLRQHTAESNPLGKDFDYREA